MLNPEDPMMYETQLFPPRGPVPLVVVGNAPRAIILHCHMGHTRNS
jgi:hypothetical protein